MTKPNAIPVLYDHEYAAAYPDLYLDPWPDKHDLNVAIVSGLAATTLPPEPRWLDLGCGQAWHFGQVDGFDLKVGVDMSPSQLQLAAAANPEAEFIRADISHPTVQSNSFDLVTSFWAAYCYLEHETQIRQFVSHAVDAVTPGGCLYVEVLVPGALPTFNASEYAGETGFEVAAAQPGFGRWQYRDLGGRHDMLSLELDFFVDALTGPFDDIRTEHDGGFMWHLLAVNKKR